MSLTDFTSGNFSQYTNSSNPLWCQYCDKHFRSFASYTRHIETVHHIEKGRVKKSCVPEWDDKNDICDERCCGTTKSCIIL